MRDFDKVVERIAENERKAENLYRELMNKLKDPEYADFRVLLLRMTVDTVLHKNVAEALKKTYEDALKLIQEFGYNTSPTIPEYAPRKQLEVGTVLIPGLPALMMPSGELLVDKIPPEEALDELLRTRLDSLEIPREKLEGIKETLKRVLEIIEAVEREYERIEERAIHPVVRSIAKETRMNEEQHRKVIEGILGR